MNVDEAMAIVNSSNLAAEWYDAVLGPVNAMRNRADGVKPPFAKRCFIGFGSRIC